MCVTATPLGAAVAPIGTGSAVEPTRNWAHCPSQSAPFLDRTPIQAT
jgi:hypothetical protein